MVPTYPSYCFFAGGLTFFVLAALANVLLRRHAVRPGGLWLVGFAVAQGLSEWTAIAASRPDAWAFFAMIRLALQVLSLAALIEYGRSSWGSPKLWQARWVYPILVAAAFYAALIGPWTWFEFAYRALLVGQGGLLAGRFLAETMKSPEKKWLPIIFSSTVLLYLVAAFFQIGILQVIALLALATAVWQINRHQREPAQRGSSWSQYQGPAAFLLMLAIGWYLFETPAPELAEQSHPVQEYQTADDGTEYVEVDSEPARKSELTQSLERGGMAYRQFWA